MSDGRGVSPAQQEQPPVTDVQREAWLDEVRTALKDLREQTASLRHGMKMFPPDFDKGDWREAFDAPVPQRNQCDTALLAFLVGVGELNTVVQTGAVLDGLMSPALKKTQAPNHYKALEKVGVLRPSERTTLTTINRVRNGVAHIYGEATADEVHEAIEEFEKLLSGDLSKRIKAWLVGLGL
jgi:hypothetical protein